MFYRRKLPHWHPDISEGTFLFVTWRLAGSMPRTQVLQRQVGESSRPTTPALSAGRAFLAWDREVDQAAFGPVWLRDARIARVVADALVHGESGRNFYQLRAWVVMPNHVHVLLRPMTSLPVITRWLKRSTARQANLILGRTGEPFWQDESFDHRVRDEVELDRIVRYVEHNPVSAGLARDPRDWAWSSARLAGESAQCHIVFGITGANWVTLSEPDQPRRTGDRFLGEAFAVASACLAAFARAERDSFSSRLSSSFNLWYCCEAAL
jgi:putative transposase